MARFEADPDHFVEHFLTQDECWVDHFEPETKRQSMRWKALNFSCSKEGQSGAIHRKMHDCGFELIDHPPYSPDLAPLDYFLFPNLKKHFAGKLYKSDDDVISAVEDFFLRVRRRTSMPLGSEHCSTDGKSVWTAEEIMLKNEPTLVNFKYFVLVRL